MKNTTNYGLNKPETTDYYNVEHQNENMEIIDSKLKELEDGESEAVDVVTKHVADKKNPHGVTAQDVGLGNVPNVTTNNQTPTYTVASTLVALVNGETLSVAFGKIAKAVSSLISHLTNVNNPHSVTKVQIGLGNVDNTSDANKSVKYATTAGSAPASDVSAWAKASTKPSYSKSEVGLSNVPNVATNDQTPTYNMASDVANLVSGEKLSVAFGKIAKAINTLMDHIKASATASASGHVKLSDTYASKVANGAAANGVGASQNALYNVYNALFQKAESVNESLNVRYNSDNDYTQIFYNGVWNDWIKAGLQKYYLFSANNNVAEFEATSTYGISHNKTMPTFSVGEVMKMSTTTTGGYGAAIVSKPIDVTGYSKLIMKHYTYFHNGGGSYDKCTLWVASELSTPIVNTVASNLYLTNATETYEDVEVDLSAVSGVIYVGVTLHCNNTDGATAEIEEMWLE